MKKKVLMVTEFSELPTGYSVYSKELLTRLNKEFEVAELAAYVSANDPKLNNVRWQVFPNKPLEGTAEYDSYKQSAIAEFGEFSFNSVVLQFKPDFVIDIRDFWMLSYEQSSPYRQFYNWCFTKNTPVLCAGGQYKNISDLRVGDSILDGDYKSTSVKNISVRQADSVIRLKTSGYGLDINTTKEHSFFVIKNQGRVWCNKLRRYYLNKEYYSNSKAIELEANFINKGDMLVFPPIEISIDNSIDYSDSMATLVGFFISEGTCDRYGHIRFSLHEEEKEYALEIKNALTKIYPLCKIEERFIKDKKSLIIGINNTEAVKNVWSKFYDSNGYKIMPDWVFNSPPSFISKVIKSMWSGDGCVVKNIHGYNGLEYFTNSKSLSLSLWQSLIRLGIVTNVIERSYNGHIGYRFFTYGENAYKLNQVVNKTNTKSKMNFVDVGKINKDRAWIDKNGYLIVKVTDKKEIFNQETVYDIEVESKNHTFLIPYKVHNCIMPTVDAKPQNMEWVETYESADAVFTYSEFGEKTLKSQGKFNNFRDVASPCASHSFFPIKNKTGLRNEFGLESAPYIVGTVMRNQRRKLYPDLFSAFRNFLNKSKREDVFLYCHTSYPDVGWDIPKLLIQNNLTHKVLFTYKCSKCGHVDCAFFSDVMKNCKKCGGFSSGICGINNPVNEKELAKIYNVFDIYVQYANSEGFGMPQLEAAQCGNVVCSVDYSAMHSVIRNINGYPIPYKHLETEVETGCLRAIPDERNFIDLLVELTSKTKEELKNIGLEIYRDTISRYNWDKTAEKWASYIRETPTLPIEQTWRSPINIKQPAPIKNLLMPLDQANFLVSEVLCKPELIGSFLWRRLLKELTYKSTVENLGGFYINEHHYKDALKMKSFTYTDAYNSMVQLREYYNIWEQHRANSL